MKSSKQRNTGNREIEEKKKKKKSGPESKVRSKVQATLELGQTTGSELSSW